MQGCGNDFVILDYSEYEKSGLSMEALAIKLCDRHFGIGADGMIIPDTNPNGETDIAWYFYNSDGTTAQMCGNGMRCFAKYVYDKKLVNKNQFSVKTFQSDVTVQIRDKKFDLTPVSMGNPHCIIFTDEDPMFLAQNYGPDMEKHPYFPEKTNTEFVKIISRTEIDMRVYERGCGITLACGTGACASVVACVLNNLTEQNVKVNLLGGAVNVEWSGNSENPNKNIFLIGPANYSFTAEYML